MIFKLNKAKLSFVLSTRDTNTKSTRKIQNKVRNKDIIHDFDIKQRRIESCKWCGIMRVNGQTRESVKVEK